MKNASVRIARLVSPKLALELRPSRRPRSPSSNHNVKEPRQRRTFILPETEHRPQDQRPSGGVGAVYRGLESPCQTVNGLNLRNFWAVVDGLFADPILRPQFRLTYRCAARSYIEWGRSRFSTSPDGRILDNGLWGRTAVRRGCRRPGRGSAYGRCRRASGIRALSSRCCRA